jgi:hypothetical protein
VHEPTGVNRFDNSGLTDGGLRHRRTIRPKGPRAVAPPLARRPGVILLRGVQSDVPQAACSSVSERFPTEGGDHEAADFDRLTSSLDALTYLYRKLDVEEANVGDDSVEPPGGKMIVAMSIRTCAMPGAFEAEANAAMRA